MRSTLGGNINKGGLLHLTCIASSAYAAILEALTAKGTDLQAAIGEPTIFTLSNAYEVGRPSDASIPHGSVEAIERVDASTYYVTVAVWCVTPTGTSAVRFSPKAVVRLPYTTGTVPTIGKPGKTNQTGSVYKQIQDSASNADGFGCCIYVDTTNLTADYLV